MSTETIRCPFVYSTGRQCDGSVDSWRVYGHRKGDPLRYAKKVRIWCSKRGDHAGIDRTFVAKERMEFYPDRLPAALYERIEASL